MKTSKLIILFLSITCLIACSYDSEDDLIDSDNIPGTGNPDGLVTYENDISTIMQNACVSCHSSPPVNGAPFSLVNFNEVNQRANGILNRMSLQNGAPGAMPPSGRLPQATIDAVQQWITDGKLEN